jgi:hypothetical protein
MTTNTAGQLYTETTMGVSTSTSYDEEGAYVRIVDFDKPQGENEESPTSGIARVVIRVFPDDEDQFAVYAYDDEGEIVYEDVFAQRELSFDPVSPLGRGASSRLQGVTGNSTADGVDGLPSRVQTGLNAIGFAPVPHGTDWLDG